MSTGDRLLRVFAISPASDAKGKGSIPAEVSVLAVVFDRPDECFDSVIRGIKTKPVGGFTWDGPMLVVERLDEQWSSSFRASLTERNGRRTASVPIFVTQQFLPFA